MAKPKIRDIRICLLTAAIMLTLVLKIAAMGSLTGEKNMTSNQDIANTILSISQERYFKSPENLFTAMELKLADSDFFGVAINAPGAVSIERQEKLPVIMAVQQTGLRGWEVPRDSNCVLIATHMDSRTVYFGQAFRDEKAELFSEPVDAAPPPKPDGISAIAIESSVSTFDARTVLSLPWESGTYRMGVVMYDWMSNGVEVTLKDSSPPTVKKASPPSPYPAQTGKDAAMPTFLPSEDIPEIEEDKTPAVMLAVSPLRDIGLRLAVMGTFSIISESIHIPEKPYTIKEVSGEQQVVGATVPATLAVFGKNWPGPLRFDWVLPVYSKSAIKAGDRIKGYFSLDALMDHPFDLEPGEYFAYLVLEGRIFGPVGFTAEADAG